MLSIKFLNFTISDWLPDNYSLIILFFYLPSTKLGRFFYLFYVLFKIFYKKYCLLRLLYVTLSYNIRR